MKRLLCYEMAIFRRGRLLWIILGVITAACCFSILTGTYDGAEQALLQIEKDSMVLLLACATYSAILVTEDFSNGLLRRLVANGYPRRSILLAKLFHSFLGCGILMLVYPCVCVAVAALLHGTQTSLLAILGETLFAFIKTFPLYGGILGLFFLFAVWIQRGVLVVSVSIAASILLVVLQNKLYAWMPSLFRHSPLIQVGEVALGPVTYAYFGAMLLSLATLAVCVWIGMVKLDRDEL